MWRNIGQGQILESRKRKLIDVIIDKNTEFADYVLKQCKKMGMKICTLGGLPRSSQVFMRAFVESNGQTNYKNCLQ